MRRLLLSNVVAALVWTGTACAAEPLDYVPADTPYVLANVDRMPLALSEKMVGMYPAGIYAEILDGVLLADAEQAKEAKAAASQAEAAGENSDAETEAEAEAEAAEKPASKPMSPATRRVLKALADEFRGKANMLDVMRSWGTRSDAKYALYGVGVIPVFRLELGDRAKFEAFVGRLEQAYGDSIKKEQGKRGTTWRFGDEKAELVVGTLDQQLFMTMLPLKADAKFRATMLEPAKTPMGARGLASFNRSKGFTGHGGGYIDIVKLAGVFTGKLGPNERALFAALDEKPPSATPQCQADFLTMAQNFPRIIMGTTQVTNKAFNLNAVVEMKPELAKELTALSAGSASAGASMFTFGMAIDPMKAVDFLKAQSDKVAAKPYVCPDLLDMNASFASMRESLNTAPTAMLAGFKGFSFALHDIKLDAKTKRPSSMTGTLALTSDAPMMLLGLAQATLPQLAGLSIQPDGKSVALAAEAMPEMIGPTFVSMGDKFLALANGKDAQVRLAKVAATPIASSGPFMSASITGGFYGLMADLMVMASPEKDSEKRLVEASAEIYRTMQNSLSKAEVKVNFTPKGVEMIQLMEMK